MIKLSDTEMFKAFRELVATDPKNPERRSNDPLRRSKAVKQWENLMEKHDIDGMIYRAIEKSEKGHGVEKFLDDAEIAAEQRMAAAANTDLREACRQYYWPHRSFTGAIADKIKWLEGLEHNKRDAVLMAHGQPSQEQNKINREQMKALGITK